MVKLFLAHEFLAIVSQTNGEDELVRWDFLLRGATSNDKEDVCEQVRMQHGFEALFYGALGRLPVVDAVLPPVGAFDSSFVRIFLGGGRSSRCKRAGCHCRRHGLRLLRI